MSTGGCAGGHECHTFSHRSFPWSVEEFHGLGLVTLIHCLEGMWWRGRSPQCASSPSLVQLLHNGFRVCLYRSFHNTAGYGTSYPNIPLSLHCLKVPTLHLVPAPSPHSQIWASPWTNSDECPNSGQVQSLGVAPVTMAAVT